MEDKILAGQVQDYGFRRGQPDDANRLATHIQDDRRRDQTRQIGVFAEVDIGAYSRRIQPLDEFRQLFAAFIELVIAEHDGVIADRVHDLHAVLPAMLDVEERAGEAVAGIQQQTVAAFRADLLDDGRLSGGAAIAIALRLVVAMHVVRVHDRQLKRVLRANNAREQQEQN